MRRTLKTVLLAFVLLASRLSAEEFRAIGWNVESGGTDPDVIAEEIADFNGYQLWGLCEVRQTDALNYVAATGVGEHASFRYKLGTTGGADRLLLAWDPTRFDKTDEIELLDLKMGNGRAPLAVRLRSIATGQELWFMVNHLYRGDATKRFKQAAGVRDWIASQKAPVFAVGDYNFDFDIPSGPGNSAYDEMRRDGKVKWVRPNQLVKTNASPQYNAVLDFVFVNDAATHWSPTSKIIVRPGDFENPDDPDRSDHRPVETRFDTGPSTPLAAASPAPSAPRTRTPAASDSSTHRSELRDRILAELNDLKNRISRLEQLARELQDD